MLSSFQHGVVRLACPAENHAPSLLFILPAAFSHSAARVPTSRFSLQQFTWHFAGNYYVVIGVGGWSRGYHPKTATAVRGSNRTLTGSTFETARSCGGNQVSTSLVGKTATATAPLSNGRTAPFVGARRVYGAGARDSLIPSSVSTILGHLTLLIPTKARRSTPIMKSPQQSNDGTT